MSQIGPLSPLQAGAFGAIIVEYYSIFLIRVDTVTALVTSESDENFMRCKWIAGALKRQCHFLSLFLSLTGTLLFSPLLPPVPNLVEIFAYLQVLRKRLILALLDFLILALV